MKKVKIVKKVKKVKPKVNHFFKASETSKCTFPSPLLARIKIDGYSKEKLAIFDEFDVAKSSTEKLP